MLAQHWLMSKAILFNNCPPFAPHLVINTASLLSTFCKINRSEAPSSLFIIFITIYVIFDFWSFPRKIFAIFGEEMFNFMKSWKVSFFLWRRWWWWCSKTVSSPLLLMRLALPCISGCILLRRQHRIIFSTDWQRCQDQLRRFPQDAIEIASPGSLSTGMHSLHKFWETMIGSSVRAAPLWSV